MLFSILIPAYNVEKYIIQCIDSIKIQKYKNWECIIIDDGSKDNTFNVALKAIKNDCRFFLIKQRNIGVAQTRNLLLKMAKGEYVVWIDADDYISIDMLQKVYENIIMFQTECVVFNYNIINKNNIVPIKLMNTNNGFIQKRKMFSYLAQEFQMPSFLWNKVFSKRLFANIVFDNSLKMLEDYDILAELFYKSKNIFYLNDCLYNYRQIKSSITHNIDKEILKKNIIIMQKRRMFILKIYPDLIQSVRCGKAYVAIDNIIIATRNGYKDILIFYKKELKENIISYLLNNSVSIKKKVKAVLVLLNVKFFYRLKILNEIVDRKGKI